MKRWQVVTVAVVLLAAGGGYAGHRYVAKKGAQPAYRTAPVERGDIVQAVRATGTIKPVRLVEVGTQVNGPVEKLYVDFNDQVKAGDLVAQIDPTVYKARIAQDEANLTQSEASQEQVLTRLAQADRELDRARTLASRNMISTSELDTAAANRDTLSAQVKMARAAVAQARASLEVSRANLDYTTIRSPVDGVVISRNVDEGQTVVASMSAQVLFQIAADLQDIQVEASIPEADVGKIRAGQPVSFTVDAYDQTFTGSVAQVRLAAASVQNVVTYPVVVRASNPGSRLFPGMTANISCEVDRRTAVLKVPNAALRFKPDDATLKKNGEKAAGRDKGRGGPQVWTLPKPGVRPRPVGVMTGIGDGSSTEITEPSELKEGESVITGTLSRDEAAKPSVVNPFMPQRPQRGLGGGRPH